MIEFDFTDEYKERFVKNIVFGMDAQDIVEWCDE